MHYQPLPLRPIEDDRSLSTDAGRTAGLVINFISPDCPYCKEQLPLGRIRGIQAGPRPLPIHQCQCGVEASFSRPLLFYAIYPYVRAGDARFNAHPEKINSAKFTIATIDGEISNLIADADFPQAKKNSLPQLADISQMLLNVSMGKADVTFSEPVTVAAFLSKNPNTLQQVSVPRPTRVLPIGLMFRRGQFDFKDMLDAALDELIYSGEVDKIIRKYEPYPNAFCRVGSPYELAAPTRVSH